MDVLTQPSRKHATHEALENLTNSNRQAVLSNSPWYTPGIDFWFDFNTRNILGKYLRFPVSTRLPKRLALDLVNVSGS
jgi:hypothetical protein